MRRSGMSIAAALALAASALPVAIAGTRRSKDNFALPSLVWQPIPKHRDMAAERSNQSRAGSIAQQAWKHARAGRRR